MPPETSRLIRYQAIIRQHLPHAPIGQHLGIELTAVATGKAIFEMDVVPSHCNSIGTVQGGVLCTLADAAMGIAFGTLIPEESNFTTLEMKINFIKPVFSGHLIAEGMVIHKGKRTGVAECSLFLQGKEEQRILIAKTSSSLVILPAIR